MLPSLVSASASRCVRGIPLLALLLLSLPAWQSAGGLVAGDDAGVPLAASGGEGAGWLPTVGDAPGVDGGVRALLTFDDGDGPALYAGGSFSAAGTITAPGIARWDGTRWASLGDGIDLSFPFGVGVRALAVFHDGGGPALYAAGNFLTAGGVSATRIARWDGAAWSPLGSGMDDDVRALAVFDDGGGPALYAAGDFVTAGGVTVQHVARWDGSSWSAVGAGTNGAVLALTVHDDGGGPALWVGGTFDAAGEQAAGRIARWDGSAWSSVGDMAGPSSQVETLAVFDGELHAGGQFTTAMGVATSNIARWNGATWSALGAGTDGAVEALTVHDGALFAGGAFTGAGGAPANHVARWDGAAWAPLGDGTSSNVGAFTSFDDGQGTRLFMGGFFAEAGSQQVRSLAGWDGAEWSLVGGHAPDDEVRALALFDDGGGEALFVGGAFHSVGGVAADFVARWDGETWAPLGDGIEQQGYAFGAGVNALAVFDDGGGPALYAGGEFNTAGGLPATRIARWDGAAWSPVGSGMEADVRELVVFDDGGGPALYAAGDFHTAGGVTAEHVARWDGSAWSAVGGGIDVLAYALAVHDDGSGPALYVGGSFSTAGGVPAANVARWDGTSWSALGGGTNGHVSTLAVFDDGGGADLYAGGSFTHTEGEYTSRIARWDGTAWSGLAGGIVNNVRCIAAFDDGSGPALFVGGSMWSVGVGAGQLSVRNIARFDGASWASLDGVDLYNGGPVAMLAADLGDGPALHVGGSFTRLGEDDVDAHFTRWGCPPTPTWADLGSALAGTSGDPLLVGTGSLSALSPIDIDLTNALASTTAWLVVGFAELNAAFYGGNMVPDIGGGLAFPLPTSKSGTFSISDTWPDGVPSGFSLYLQYWIEDPGAIFGYAGSNAVRGTTP